MKANIQSLLKQQLAGALIQDEVLYVLVVPDQVIAHISTEPRLPIIPVQVQLVAGTTLNGEVQYMAFIEYTEHGRTDKTAPVSGRAVALAFTINFGDVLQGGQFVVDLVIPWKNASGQTGTKQTRIQGSIRGTNPTKAAIKARLGSIELQVTAYRESRFRQFDSAGLPLFGPPHGFGVMQLDNPPATARQVWDWKTNVDAGKSLWAVKAQDATGYPSRERRKYPDVTNFTAEQLKLEIYQRYNGGAYWKWDDARKTWFKGPINSYADDAYALEQQVQAGQAPPDWS